jgi:hypothetical protein
VSAFAAILATEPSDLYVKRKSPEAMELVVTAFGIKVSGPINAPPGLAIFLPIVFVLYWFIFNNNIKIQNFFIVVTSYFFYGWWEWKFLTLIVFSTFII